MLSIRKIEAFGRTYRHLNRYRQILGILIKYGFGDLIERLNIDQYIEIGLQFISSKPNEHHFQKQTRAERIRLALEELGPTYVKLGQLLSTRPDLLPINFIDEFAKLQDNVKSFSYQEVENILCKTFNQPLEEIFSFFEKTPIASASIGQVHKALLKNEDIVAVKIRRPGIRKIVEVDLEIMLHLAMLMEGNLEEMALHRPVKIVEEFARLLEKELDYKIEAANVERFSRQFFEDSSIYVPKVYNSLTTERILTMEYIQGIKISDIDKLKKSGLDRKKIVSKGADLFLRQIFDHGFFHADPHPGNILVLKKNIICLLDFGMVGTVDRYKKGDFVNLIYSVVHQDEVKTTQMLLKLTSWEQEPEIRFLERDVSELMGQYLNKPLKDIEISSLLRQMLELMSDYHLRLPPDVFLMIKVLSTIESIAHLLDPDFDMVSQVAPFIKREKIARFHPQRIAENILSLSSDLLEFMHQFPKDALEVVKLIKSQQLTVKFEHHGLEKLVETHDRISNKISFAIIIAALIIGSSIVIIAKIPPLLYGISFIGIVVFIAAAVMGIWLIFAILRKGSF
ncbi:Putative protein kinase, UbiB-like [Desulfonema limicola]|uniref:Protein kinase domain-containing protein n=1 Tax=Desulfonema limicola TaxID=45656 RepID=A0A975GGC7_9BACT|nr:AarF/UbiB family protein [Desulfonema limicola]QTA80171.1 Putative protein kinase, UbiB-like [Desulfonema limicola]